MKLWKVILASDHAGLELKRHLAAWLTAAGHHVADAGTHTEASCDYPDFAAVACRRLLAGEFERGVFVCGTGVGICMAANKVPGVRAVTATLEYAVEMSRRHNDAQVLCLGARLVAPGLAEQLTRRFLETEYEAGRHALRVRKLGCLDGSVSP